MTFSVLVAINLLLRHIEHILTYSSRYVHNSENDGHDDVEL